VDKGAKMLRVDLNAAGIPYRDAAGLVFDFHALRCQTATLADKAGVSPRVVQKMMRHSSLELTGRYTRPRAVDIEAAASKLPSLKPEGDHTEALAATGTNGRFDPRHPSDPTGPAAPDPRNSSAEGATHKQPLAPSCIHSGDAPGVEQCTSVRDDSPAVLKGEFGTDIEKTPENKAQDALVRLGARSCGDDEQESGQRSRMAGLGMT
jgi:hypothetical protein